MRTPETDNSMLERALSVLRFSLQQEVNDPEEHDCDIYELARDLRTYLKAAPLRGEEP